MCNKVVCFFVTSLDSGGIENYLLRFLKFSTNKFKPIVICKSGKFGELKSQYDELNVRLISLRLGYFNLKDHIRLYRVLSQLQVDVVCDFTGNFAGFPLYISKLLGIPKRIVFYRGATDHFKKTRGRIIYNKLVKKLVNKNATKILSNSTAALDYFYPERISVDKRFRVIYNGIILKHYPNTTEYRINLLKEFNFDHDSFIIGHIGRINSAKNQEIIVKVADILCNKYPNVYFVLCGKDSEAFVEQHTTPFSILNKKLIALGYRNDVSRIIRLFDVFLFPSNTEGQPNALIEAMISGLPIIASDIEPIKETTPKEAHQWLKKPNDVMGYVNILEEAYLNREFLKSLKYKDWAIKNFNPNILFNEFLSEIV